MTINQTASPFKMGKQDVRYNEFEGQAPVLEKSAKPNLLRFKKQCYRSNI